jgi:hypothetical protein
MLGELTSAILGVYVRGTHLSKFSALLRREGKCIEAFS